MRKPLLVTILILALLLIGSGCTVLTGAAIGAVVGAAILLDDETSPEPICNAASAGITFHGKRCVQFRDGECRWLMENNP